MPELLMVDSLQRIVALLEAQYARSDEAIVREALDAAVRRVVAISRLHAVLPPGEAAHVTAIDLKSYLHDLLQRTVLGENCVAPLRTVRVRLEAVGIHPARAQALGLIICELMDNAIRHGTAQGGRVWLTGTHTDDGSYRLRVEDDRLGMAAGTDWTQATSGLGLLTARLTALEVGAELQLMQNGGTCATVCVQTP